MSNYYKTLAFLVLLCAGQQAIAQNFIAQWNLATAGSGANQLTFGTATGGTVNYTWQEISPGTASGSGSWSVSPLTITGLPTGATIRLQIAPTNFQRIIINFGSDRSRLTQVEQWGSTAWVSMQDAFFGCANLQVTATDVPNLSGVANMSQMFRECTNLNSPGNIGSWNTGIVTNMQGMFRTASAFNQNIGAWNTTAVTNMLGIFQQALAFNQNIGAWNTGAVTNMTSMFQLASAFNNGGNGSINNWNTAAVTNMSSMFIGASAFNQNIGAWNTAAVTNMQGMFQQASVFNQNIGSWNTGAVTQMTFMFNNASAFNQNIGTWNTGAVTSMTAMFSGATAFNNGGNGSINNWDTGAVTAMDIMFTLASTFNQNIGSWNTAAVTNMSSMFTGASAFNQNIGAWNTSAVTNMRSMFSVTTAFNNGGNGSINNWNTSSVTNMGQMFEQANVFNQNIGAWNTGAVTNMFFMFQNALSFNQNIGTWTLNPGVTLSNMLNNTGMDCNNYSATLIGWSANPSTPNGRTLGVTGRQYGTNAVAARTNLTSTKGWTITGDTPSGAVCFLVPMITGFTPTSDPIGTTVTITGTNFDPTPANNIVMFNGITAVVTASSATSITTTVPVGATNGTITVTVAGNTATSTTSFCVTPAAPTSPVASLNVCPGNAATLTASGGTNGQYRWYTVASGGTAISGQTNNTYVASGVSIVTTFYVSINNGTCESPRTPVVVTPISSVCASPSITPASISVAIGDNKSLDLKPLITTTSGTLDINSISVTVPPQSGARATVTGGVLNLDYQGIAFAGKETITIRACDTFGNCSTQQIEIEVAGDINLYNGISPNGDGLNDFWIIQYIDVIGETKDNKVSVYNRWGDVVFETENYDNKDRVFKGLNKNGNEVSSGTYFYKIEFAGGRKAETGYLSVKK